MTKVHPMEWAKRVTRGANGAPLDTKEKVVLMLLVDMTNPKTGDAWPRVATLAEYGCMGERTVRYAIAGLKEKGLLEVRYVRMEDNRNAANRYRVLVQHQLLGDQADVVVEDTPEPAAQRLGIREVARDLCGEAGIIDDLLVSMDPTSAYVTGLTYADELAAAYPELSKDPQAFLRNAVVLRAAYDTHGIDAKSAARLTKEAKVLGNHGHARIVQALTHTASANITGDPVSYICAAARRLNQERTHK